MLFIVFGKRPYESFLASIFATALAKYDHQGLSLFDLHHPKLERMNNIKLEAKVIPQTILFQSKIFWPSSTPSGNKLNIAIQLLKEAPSLKT